MQAHEVHNYKRAVLYRSVVAEPPVHCWRLDEHVKGHLQGASAGRQKMAGELAIAAAEVVRPDVQLPDRRQGRCLQTMLNASRETS